MADVLILGMEMPRKGQMLVIFPDGTSYVCFNGMREHLAQTEAVPVPPHGALIDANALWVEINKICDRRDAGIITDLTCLQQILSALRHAPTIIPASEGYER